ncbi:hypothetical protein [Leptospira adleri]|nr:hypothetical protein [Leptospira adleri]
MSSYFFPISPKDDSFAKNYSPDKNTKAERPFCLTVLKAGKLP